MRSQARRQRLWAFGAAAVASLGLAACSSGSGGPNATTSSTAGAGSLTVAQAQVVAKAVNLTAADVPGFTGTPHASTSQDKQTSDQLARCAGATPPSQALLDAYSDDFNKGQGLQTESVSSDVTAWQSPATVQGDLAAIKSTKAQDCFVQFIDQQLSSSAGQGVQFSNAKVAPMAADAPGTDGSFGYRMTLEATAQGVNSTVYVDVFGFAVKNYEVELDDFAIGQAFSNTTEQQLLGLLASRATAAVH